MDIQTINQRYGRYIWKVANRYHTGIWSATDVFNQILLSIHSTINAGKLGEDESQATVMRTKSVIITRAINIIRHEKRRKFSSLDPLSDERFESIEPAASPSPAALDCEIRLIRELLFAKLDERTAKFIFELIFPSPETIEIAIKERVGARDDYELRMNINNELHILPKHVAESLAYSKSGVSISRVMNRAREGLSEYFEYEEVSLQSVVDEILRLG